jgi:DNA mismatch endonuclease (patch repair protein)
MISWSIALPRYTQQSSATCDAMAPQPFKRTERALVGLRSLRTTPDASARMAKVRQRGTEPELAVRDAARIAKLRLGSDNRDLPGSPDLANRTRKVAVFVHGCYWHRHSDCPRSTTPKRNREFWLAKFRRNIARDAVAIGDLKALGFNVVVVWGCEAPDAALIAKRLLAATS